MTAKKKGASKETENDVVASAVELMNEAMKENDRELKRAKLEQAHQQQLAQYDYKNKQSVMIGWILSEFYVELDDYKKAQKLCEDICEFWHKEDSSDVYEETCRHLGVILFYQDKFEEALPYLTKGLAKPVHSRWFNLWANYGDCLEATQQLQNADSAFTEFLIASINLQDKFSTAVAYSRLFSLSIKIMKTLENDNARKSQTSVLGLAYIAIAELIGDDRRKVNASKTRETLNAEGLGETPPSVDEYLEFCRAGKLAALYASKECGFGIETSFIGERDILKTPIPCAANGRIANFLIENGADTLTEASESKPLTHTLIELVAAGKVDISVLKKYVPHHFSINSLDWDEDNGDYAIHAAARTGNATVLKVILDAGASPAIASNEGDTALGIAASMGNIPMVRLLIEAGSPLYAEEFEFAIEWDDEDDQPEVSEPIEKAKTKKVAAIIEAAQDGS